jgi:DNA-directed RNA polymerase subunit F
MELREQIIEIISTCNGWHMGDDYPEKAADQILSLMPQVDELLRVIEETDMAFVGFDVNLYINKLQAIKAAAERCK